MSPSLAPFVYAPAGLLLAGTATYLWTFRRRSAPVRWFVGVCATALFWFGALYVLQYAWSPETVLVAARLNFAAALLVCYALFRLSRAVSGTASRLVDQVAGGLSALIALTVAITPLLDQREYVGYHVGQHYAEYGWMIQPYAALVAALLTSTVIHAFRERVAGRHLKIVKDQLLYIAAGILGILAILLVTHVILPHWAFTYRAVDVGPVAAVLLLSLIAVRWKNDQSRQM